MTTPRSQKEILEKELKEKREKFTKLDAELNRMERRAKEDAELEKRISEDLRDQVPQSMAQSHFKREKVTEGDFTVLRWQIDAVQTDIKALELKLESLTPKGIAKAEQESESAQAEEERKPKGPR